jgi:hypothetical protein
MIGYRPARLDAARPCSRKLGIHAFRVGFGRRLRSLAASGPARPRHSATEPPTAEHRGSLSGRCVGRSGNVRKRYEFSGKTRTCGRIRTNAEGRGGWDSELYPQSAPWDMPRVCTQSHGVPQLTRPPHNRSRSEHRLAYRASGVLDMHNTCTNPSAAANRLRTRQHRIIDQPVQGVDDRPPLLARIACGTSATSRSGRLPNPNNRSSSPSTR